MVTVRPRALSIFHQVVNVVSPAQFTPGVAFRGGASGDSVQSFSLDLTDSPTTARRCIRMHVWLRAEYSRRISGQLEFFWREDPLDDTPAAGVIWMISQVDPGRSLPARLPTGSSDERGISRFSINDEGAYELAIQENGREWVIPFTIAYAANEEAPIAGSGPANQQSTDSGATDSAGAGGGGVEFISVIRPIGDDDAISMISMDQIRMEPGNSPTPRHQAQATYTRGQRLTDDFGTLDMIVEREMSGGLSVIATGLDRVRGRWVAVKSIRSDFAEVIRDERWQRLQASFTDASLQSVGSWPHPNLLSVEDVTQIKGQTAQVLAYAEQGSLRELLMAAQRESSRLPLGTALSLAQQIAAGMVALHSPAPELMQTQPVVHSDLKPENILLSSDGRALIADIGSLLAFQWLQEDSQAAGQQSQEEPAYEQTSLRRIVGTPAYMAPERWQARQFALPSDVYAFGLLLSELIAGRHALLDLDQPHTLEQWRVAHERNFPRPLEALDAQLPEQLQRLYQQMLAKRPEDRPSMAEALAMLQEIARSLGIEVYAPNDLLSPTGEATVAFWFRWAAVYMRFERYSEALVRAEAALRVAPRNPAAVRLLAAILAELGRYVDAVAACALALEVVAPEEGRERGLILGQLGAALSSLERDSEAEAAFAETTALMPIDADAWFNRAINAGKWTTAERAEGRVEAARTQVEAGLAHIEQALQLNPDHPHYRQLEQALLQMMEELRGQG